MRSEFRVLKAAVAGVLVVLALSGCGRKGALEAPPNAAAVTAAPVVDPTKSNAEQGDAARATAPKKKFFLDFLL